MTKHHSHDWVAMNDLESWNWTTFQNIERDINRNVPSRLLKSVSVTEFNHTFIVSVKLVWWSWLALGFIHRHYQKKLQARCDIGKPAAVTGKVQVR